ncbi:hypothetical protein [Nocardia sp. NPDC004711]
MTGDEALSANPYWDIVGPSVSDRDGRRVVDGGRPNGSARLAYAQTILQAAYAYAIPSPETLSWIAEQCAGMPIVELGAGRGYWAALLAKEGLEVDAYDSEPPDVTANISFPAAAGKDPDAWHPVGDLKSFDARIEGADHALFLCWPPGWGDSMASQALLGYERLGGSRLIFIGELKGGKTGDDAFFDLLTSQWKMESQDLQHVSWWNLRDIAQCWVRR